VWQRWNLCFQELVRDCTQLGMRREALATVEAASSLLLTLCNWLSAELVRRVPKACIGPRGELCLRLPGTEGSRPAARAIVAQLRQMLRAA